MERQLNVQSDGLLKTGEETGKHEYTHTDTGIQTHIQAHKHTCIPIILEIKLRTRAQWSQTYTRRKTDIPDNNTDQTADTVNEVRSEIAENEARRTLIEIW